MGHKTAKRSFYPDGEQTNAGVECHRLQKRRGQPNWLSALSFARVNKSSLPTSVERLLPLSPGTFPIVCKDRIDIIPALPRKEIHVLARRQSLLILAKIHACAGTKRGFVLAGCADDRVWMIVLQLQLDLLTSRADIPRILFIILM